MRREARRTAAKVPKTRSGEKILSVEERLQRKIFISVEKKLKG